MALPALTKSWQHRSSTLLGYGSGATNQNARALLLALHNHLLSFTQGGPSSGAPQLRGSINGSGAGGMNGTNNWTTESSVGWDQSTNYPWVCYKFADGTELLLVGRGSNTSAGQNVAGMWISQASGFVHTVATARPTAADEINIYGAANLAWGISASVGTQYVVHSQLSTDGTQWRFFLMSAQALRGWAGFAKCAILKSGLDPYVGFAGGNSGSAANYSNSFTPQARHAGGGGLVNAHLTTEAKIAGTAVALPAFIQNANSWDGSWPMLAIGLAGDTLGGYGRQGIIPDLWLTSTALAAGTGIPKATDGLGAEDQFAVLGAFVTPNPTGLPLAVT